MSPSCNLSASVEIPQPAIARCSYKELNVMTGKEVVNFRGLKALGIPYSRTHIWRLMRAGLFPQSFKLGNFPSSPPVWWLHEVIEWLEAKASSRQALT
jgi:predicted DNA-binding transcriptional regulator AlpA